jgi:photosystem II stability/assembly factor-like uncharacterized protein
VCFDLGDDGQPPALRTADGGRTWSKLPFPGFADLACATAERCVAIDDTSSEFGRLETTTNGGASFAMAPDPSVVTPLSASSRSS